MFRLPLFRIRAFIAGTFASFLSAVGKGGLMFMMIIWLQGIWLPEHGYEISRTPLWAETSPSRPALWKLRPLGAGGRATSTSTLRAKRSPSTTRSSPR